MWLFHVLQNLGENRIVMFFFLSHFTLYVYIFFPYTIDMLLMSNKSIFRQRYMHKVTSDLFAFNDPVH